ncbi:MAG: hypothetical protein PHN44_08710 [Candidatus Marinimicrobia bacterium]|jgi:hypothetical protein|nr:hypothetical protein [Candidatus Neomarinimicrobiota bacterium]
MIDQETRIITPLQSFYYMHHPIEALQWLWNLDRPPGLPPTSIERIYLYWYAKFATDCSGRSTGKSHDALMVINAKLILLPQQTGLLIGQDKKIGINFFTEYVDAWIRENANYRKFVVPWSGRGDKRATRKDSGAYLRYSNSSRFETFAPDWGNDAKTVQSLRYNRVIFNEWTSYPNIQAMDYEISPTATRRNLLFRDTRKFQAAMETYMAEPLGLVTDKELLTIHAGEPDYIPRPHLKEKPERATFDIILERFLANFKKVYHFDYMDGVARPETGLKPIESLNEIREFFRLFIEGDTPYQGQIIYDGSAKPPESPSYMWIEQMAPKLGREARDMAGIDSKTMSFKDWQADPEIRDHRYSYYSVSVDDIPKDYDCVVFDYGIINKFRQENLPEVYAQVYGGKWVSGFARKPYDPALIAELRVTRDDPRYFEITDRGNGNHIYIGALDAAKGKESLRKGVQEYRGLGRGGGDDAAGVWFEVNDGTETNPDKLVFSYLAEDVRGEPVAYDVQGILERFPTTFWLGLDPNGGGGAVADGLKKNRVENNNKQARDCIPVLPIDYTGNEHGKQILVFMSRSTQMLKNLRVSTKDEQAKWKGDDVFYNHMHSKAQAMLMSRSVLFPPYYSEVQLIDMLKEHKITRERYEQILTVELAIKQLSEIEIELDPHTRKPKLTGNGVYSYTAPHKKDLGYSIVYALFLISVWRDWQEIGKKSQNRIGWWF